MTVTCWLRTIVDFCFAQFFWRLLFDLYPDYMHKSERSILFGFFVLSTPEQSSCVCSAPIRGLLAPLQDFLGFARISAICSPKRRRYSEYTMPVSQGRGRWGQQVFKAAKSMGLPLQGNWKQTPRAPENRVGVSRFLWLAMLCHPRTSSA